MQLPTGAARSRPACRNGHRVGVTGMESLPCEVGGSCVQTSAMPAAKSTNSAAVSVMSPSEG